MKWKTILIAVPAVAALLFLGIQLVPVNRTNPPVTAAIQEPAGVQKIVAHACFDCHSNETVWPWYSHVAPVSWLLAHDVSEGRAHLNFSTWGELDPDVQKLYRQKIYEEVKEGNMPPGPYVLMHSEARLSSEDKDILRQWAKNENSAGEPLTGSASDQ